MKTIGGIFFKGLAAILPLTITIYFFYWLGSTAGTLMEPVYYWAFNLVGIDGPLKYQQWMGMALVLAIVFGVGILMNAYIIRIIFEWGELLLQKIPLVKTLYGSMRDLMGFFAAGDDQDKKMNQVVMVKVGGTSVRLVGLVTRDDFSDLPTGVGDEGTVAVYLPMSYQLGGFTTMVPKEDITPIDMTVEEAMRFAVTAGMTSKA